jgi:hypothetical protein
MHENQNPADVDFFHVALSGGLTKHKKILKRITDISRKGSGSSRVNYPQQLRQTAHLQAAHCSLTVDCQGS